MKPKKTLIEIAKENGSIDRMNQLFSAIQILNSQANSLAEECADLMQRNGLLLGRLKQSHNNFVKAAANYFREFSLCIFADQRKMDMFNDMDSFADVFYRWSQLERTFTPKGITNQENN